MAPADVCARLRADHRATVFLDGAAGFDDRWGPLLAVRPRVVSCDSFEAIADRVDARRAAGEPCAATGLAVLLSYRSPWIREPRGRFPAIVTWDVDRSVAFEDDGRATITVRGGDDRDLDGIESLLAESRAHPVDDATPAVPAATSLPRDRYLAAVARVREHILDGDIYQANLTQTFTCPHAGDPFDTYRRLVIATPAPRAAFVDDGRVATASVSPEMFLRGTPDRRIETRPIKGTRPRGETPEADRLAAEALLASDKDRAELVMIVDLERNDLGRVAEIGSVEVPELAGLRSYPAVHHLVARVEARLRDDAGIADLLHATFPGGSITGAPKRRAMEILDTLEPVPREYYTGSLLWFGDDGSIESSILIRTVIVSDDRAWLGSGGGVVVDSDPEGEWIESNDKARALAAVLGFRPENAT